ncbi:hypothetical protein RvY_00062-2 [Ramazzottius varieornatus]|uniref:Uncharacterized protein n=1 Tax=Ramazzottius varieornatus TaxID=947166 RepID=A0A1D1UCC4_RAMVA|nr:hypothetical protein RvY_00062-2 [Ramazzottius varieornatus]
MGTLFTAYRVPKKRESWEAGLYLVAMSNPVPKQNLPRTPCVHEEITSFRSKVGKVRAGQEPRRIEKGKEAGSQ